MNALRAPEDCGCPISLYGPPMVPCFSQAVLFMTIIEAYINGRCHLADPCKRIADSEADNEYDFVVVGGGTSGPVVAGRLAENPEFKVLLLEAGGDEPTPSEVPAMQSAYRNQPSTDWMYRTEPQKKACLAQGGKCVWVRGKLLGGCAVVNGMMWIRGHAPDYNNWGLKGWTWADVLPYYKKLENNKQIGTVVSASYHFTGGPVSISRFPYAPPFASDFIQASRQIGMNYTNDLNGKNFTGFTIAQTMNEDGVRYSTPRAYLRELHGKKVDRNIHISYHSHVTRVILDSSKKVTGVEYVKNGKKRIVKVRQEAILSAGTMNTPQLLMLSGIGPKETLRKFNITPVVDLPGVGQNLHNHVGVQLKFKLEKEKDIPILNWTTAVDYLLKREGPMSSTGLSQLTGILNSKHAPRGGQQPDIQFFFDGFFAACGDGKDYSGYEGSRVTKKRTVSIFTINTQPKSRGYISLRSANPFEAPVMEPNYFQDERDMKVIMDAARTAYRIANSTLLRQKYGMIPMPGYGDECQKYGKSRMTDAYLRCLIMQHTAPENHQTGTCKMGPKEDSLAVVDLELKVHGVQGLRVIDASVMPTVITAGTVSFATMVGERGAEFIVNDHKSKGISGLLKKVINFWKPTPSVTDHLPKSDIFNPKNLSPLQNEPGVDKIPIVNSGASSKSWAIPMLLSLVFFAGAVF